MPDYESIRIYPKTKSAISKLSKKWEMTQVNFLQTAMDYFQTTGVNPKDDKVLSPAEELKKFRDTIISFMRKQEKEYILPTFGKMDALIAMFVKYVEEDAPRKDDTQAPVFKTSKKDAAEDSGEANFEIPQSTQKEALTSDLANELEREKAKLKTMKEYFDKVIGSIEVKSTGMQRRPIVDLPMGEINGMKEFLSRL